MSIKDVLSALESSQPSMLDPSWINSCFQGCLSDHTEGDDVVVVDGIVLRAALDLAKLESHREAIEGLLAKLPIQFRSPSQGGGGGWSFLNACFDINGDQWTGEHRVVEQLFLLGMGLGLVSYLMPREMWTAFPGGMPYLGLAELPEAALAYCPRNTPS